MITWVFIETMPQVWSVGFYSPEGKWHRDADYNSTADAAARVHYLNGGFSMKNYDLMREVFVAIGRTGANQDPQHALRPIWEKLREAIT